MPSILSLITTTFGKTKEEKVEEQVTIKKLTVTIELARAILGQKGELVTVEPVEGSSNLLSIRGCRTGLHAIVEASSVE